MGATVTDLPVSPVMNDLINHSREISSVMIRSGTTEEYIEDMSRGFEITNKCLLDVMTDWHEFLEQLERNPKNYKGMCRDGDVEAAINGLDKASKTMRKKSWLDLGETIRKTHPDVYREFKVVDENVEAFCALLQEVSWNLLILHRENQPGTEEALSMEKAIEDLWS